MNYYKWITLAIFSFITGYTSGQEGQSAYYQKAAQVYRDAAAKTKCPATRGKVLIEYAEWNERMVKVLAGTLSSAGPQPTTPIPPCDGDMIGGGSGSASSATGNGAVSSPISSLGTTADQSAATAAMNAAYENALNSGRKESGAMLEGFLAAAQSTSDVSLSNAYAGTGLVVSGIMALAERKAEKQAAAAEQERLEELQRQKEEAERQLIDNKYSFVKNFEKKFFLSDFSQVLRKAVLLSYPVTMTAESQDIFISNPVSISPYSDGSFPLKENVLKKIMNTLPAGMQKNETMAYLLVYPVKEENNFSQVLSRIGSACGSLNLNPKMFIVSYQNDKSGSNDIIHTSHVDFWGRPIKDTVTNTLKQDSVQKKDNFWND
jgi:hypothetical protein